MALAFPNISSNGNASNNAGASTERPKSKVWLNVGYNVPVKNDETGEVENVFINLPFGLGLDTMSPAEYSGSSDRMHMITAAKNQLLEMLQKLADENIAAGEAEIVEGLEIQIRRKAEASATVSNSGTNPFLAAMADRFKVAS